MKAKISSNIFPGPECFRPLIEETDSKISQVVVFFDSFYRIITNWSNFNCSNSDQIEKCPKNKGLKT
jgi:hypothetical protein